MGLLAAFAAGIAVPYDLPGWAYEMTKLWGPGFLMVFTVLSAFFYYVPRDAVQKFIVSQEGQVLALQKVGDKLEVMIGQAGKLEEIKEMLIESQVNQQVITDRLKNIETHCEKAACRNDE